jgi:feruloyl esterase
MCGAVNGLACNAGLARGYASVTGNGGHDGASPTPDGLWAAGDPALQEDYAWRSNHVITLVAKSITTRYYGQPIQRSYIAGCSKGGQAVLMEAQRFPEDFDGFMPAAPVYDQVRLNVVEGAWIAQAVDDGKGGSVLNAAAADAAHKSVLTACGAQTGVDIGLVTEPTSCNWKPEMIACSAGTSGPDCLSPVQVAAIKRLMIPPTNRKGEVLYPYPFIPGTETQWAFGVFADPQFGPRSAAAELFEATLKYLADPQPRSGVDPLKFNFDRDPATLARARKLYDAASYDLSRVKNLGGKILMWNGLADGAVKATSSIGYYLGVEKAMGGREKTQDFFRLFLIPGVHHCAGGPGLTDFDALTALENWVEKGQAPTQLIAQRMTNGAAERALPIYPYPLVPRYSGTGDPKLASSFKPFDSTRK